MSEYVYVRRLKDGQVLDIPKKHLEMTLKKGFELIGDVTVYPETATEQDDTTGLVCPLCGFEAKGVQSLRMHKMKKHA